MNKLVKKQNYLPDNIKDLTKFVLIGREKLVAVRAAIRVVDKLGLATDVREQKREEATWLAGALLDAEARMGELIKNIPNKKASSGAGTRSLPNSITKKQSHHFQTLAENKDIIEQVKADAEAEDDLPTRTEVLRRVKEEERDKDLQNIKKKIDKTNTKIVDKYDVVILDPPWLYGRIYNPKSSRVASPYPEQTDKEIYDTCKNFFKSDCVLWLWTTHQFIWQAKELLDSWGFDYKATLVWNKDTMGMGSWLRMQCEFCLLGIKGNPVFKNTTERDIIIEKRREHSRKPKAFYDLVKKTCYGSIFEYYSREKKEGIITRGIENDKMGR